MQVQVQQKIQQEVQQQVQQQLELVEQKTQKLSGFDEDNKQMFVTLYNDQDSSDLTCVIPENGNETIFVHKVIVKHYSEPLLNKILKNNQITKIERDVLKFLYTGQISNYDKKAQELIEFAHKFNLSLLKSYCEETLIATLTLENCLERFLFATKTNSTELRLKAKAFVMKENKNILKTGNWKSVIQNTEIAFELLMEGFAELQK